MDKKFTTLPNKKFKCEKCDKICNTKQSVIAHFWRAHTDKGKAHDPNKGYENGREIWNKGLKKETSKSIQQSSATFKKRIKNGEIVPSMLGKTLSKEARKKISIAVSKNNKGGRCKWYEVINGKGNFVKVQGTWERDFSQVLNLIDKDWIKPTTSTHSFEWHDVEGKKYLYTPDFYCPNLNKYFEIKGYWWGNDKYKMEKVIENNSTIIFEIVQKKELTAYMKLIR